MTSSPLPGMRGAQRPRVSSVPTCVTSAGAEAVALARSAGLELDPWQQHVLEGALGETADGQWSAFEVAAIVSRQNGKGALLEARALAGLFLFGESLILWSAHEFKTAAEAFRRMTLLIENTPHLAERVRIIRTASGSESIELHSGARLRFVARSKGSGRGFSGDCVILDEAYELSSESMAALLPTLSARPNPQVWYTSSAGMATSTQLRRVRERGAKGDSARLAYFEWSAPDDADLDSPESWALANPALGIRISQEFIAAERSALPDVEFARERLGIWEDAAAGGIIAPSAWAKCLEVGSTINGVPALAIDVTPDRTSACLAAAGRRADGRPHVESVEVGDGTDWVVARAAEVFMRQQTVGVVVDPGSYAGSLIPALEQAGVRVIPISSREYAQACGALYDLITAGTLRHIGQADLDAAVGGAGKRVIGDAWGWNRKNPAVSVAPLVAVTLAAWAIDVPVDPMSNFW